MEERKVDERGQLSEKLQSQERANEINEKENHEVLMRLECCGNRFDLTALREHLQEDFMKVLLWRQ